MQMSILFTIIALSVIAFLTILYFIIGYYLARFLSVPKRVDAAYCRKVDIDKGVIPESIPELKREHLNIISYDGSVIHGDYSECPNAKGLIITAHGYSWTREGNVKYARLFYKLGFSVYLYDERGHGENETKYTTMGYKEGKDIASIVSYFRKIHNKDYLIGIHGESLGAASIMMALKETDNVDFAIEDCGYSSLEKLLKQQIKKMHLSSIFLLPANIALKLFYHYSYKDVEPYKAVASSKVPLLIIHGEKDSFIPCEDSNDILKARSNGIRREIFKNADHALSYQSNPERYEKIVNDFVEDIGKEK